MANPQQQLLPGAVVFTLTPDVVWRLGEVVQCHTDAVIVDPIPDALQQFPPGARARVLRSHVYPVTDLVSLDDAHHDLRGMPDPHEAFVLHALRRRFHARVHYTHVGPSVTLSLNPGQGADTGWQRDDVMMPQYEGDPSADVLPHVWELAKRSYDDMVRLGKDQTVLAAGDAGSGKSHAVATMRAFVVRLAEQRTQRPVGGPSVSERLSAACAVLDAFGCASTASSAASTRWLQFCRLQFTRAGGLVGAAVDGLMLDPFSAVRAGPRDFLFNCFYQLCGSADARRVFSVAPGLLPEHEAAGSLADTNKHMATLGVRETERWSVWAVLAGILHLGRVEFEALADGTGVSVTAVSRDSLKLGAVAWGVKPADLELGLCRGVAQASAMREHRHDATAAVRACVGDAARIRDGLCADLYNGVFAYLIRRCNQSLDSADSAVTLGFVQGPGPSSVPPPATGGRCGTLDELKRQLCCELLQSFYNRQMFRAQAAEAEADGLRPVPLEFADNDDTVALVGDPVQGMLRMLGEVTDADPFSESGFLQRLAQEYTGHRSLLLGADGSQRFRVRHSSAEVEYDATGWGLDAQGPIPTWCRSALRGVVCTSKDAVIGQLLESAAGGVGADAVYPPTITFQTEAARLFVTLNSTQNRWVRCISAGGQTFDPVAVAAQLRAGNILHTVVAVQEAFTEREPVTEFAARYRCLLPPPADGAPRGNARQVCLDLLAECRPEDVCVGNTTVFIRNELLLPQLEELRTRQLARHVLLIQAFGRAQLSSEEREVRALRAQEPVLAELREKLQKRTVLSLAQDHVRGTVLHREKSDRGVLEHEILLSRRTNEDALWEEERRRERERQLRQKQRQAAADRREAEERERRAALAEAQRRQLKVVRSALKPHVRKASPERDGQFQSQLVSAAEQRAAAEQAYREARLLQTESLRQKAEARQCKRADAARRASQQSKFEEARRLQRYEQNEAKRLRGKIAAQQLMTAKSTDVDYRLHGAKQRREQQEQQLEARRGGMRNLLEWERTERQTWRQLEVMLHRQAQAHGRRVECDLRAAVQQEATLHEKALHRARAEAERRQLLRLGAVETLCGMQKKAAAEERRRDGESRRLLAVARQEVALRQRRKAAVEVLSEVAERERRVEGLERAYQRAALLRPPSPSAARTPGSGGPVPPISDDQYTRLLGSMGEREGLAAASIHSDPGAHASPSPTSGQRPIRWRM